MSKSIYQELGEERKKLQAEGKLPMWVTTPAWQILKDKYTTPDCPDLYSIYKRISTTAARHMDDSEHWQKMFFNLMWNGWLACSTPVLANMGTNRGCSVSCSGGYVGDSVYDFYDAQREVAVLSKNGFGTSSYIGDIRERGTAISKRRRGKRSIYQSSETLSNLAAMYHKEILDEVHGQDMSN